MIEYNEKEDIKIRFVFVFFRFQGFVYKQPGWSSVVCAEQKWEYHRSVSVLKTFSLSVERQITQKLFTCLHTRGVRPYMSCNRYVRPQRVWLRAIFARNRVTILTILVINRVWFWTLVLNWVRLFFFTRNDFFIIINKTINKILSYFMIRTTVSATTAINRVPNFWSGQNSVVWGNKYF